MDAFDKNSALKNPSDAELDSESKNGDGSQDAKIDMRVFFRDTERGVRAFLTYWTHKAKSNQTIYPFRMSRDAWWREFIKWAINSEAR